MRSIQVGLEGRGYQVHVGHGILERLGVQCRDLDLGRQVAVVTDRTVAPHYLERVQASLQAAGYRTFPAVIFGGDPAKNLQTAEQVFARLIEAGMDRQDWVLALGGGVVGDLAGFVAATFLRGIAWVQVPTTVVAQVDASIGGKTAVNHALGKNLIGAFHQPRLVCIDTEVLRTLPRPERVAGLAEVVKHALIRDEELFAFLEARLEEVVELQLEPDLLDWLIGRNVEIKARVVEADEREGGLRAILNYGHTIGHALEAATGYTRYRHGEGVILGMIGAGQIARQRGFWSEDEQRRQDALLERLGIPGGAREVPAEQILERARADKKRAAGQFRFVLLRGVGQAEVLEVEEAQVRAAIDYLQQRC